MHDDFEKIYRWGSRKGAMNRTRIGATKLQEELINQKCIRARKLDGRTLIDLNSLDDLIENSPVVGPTPHNKKPARAIASPGQLEMKAI